MQVINDIYIPPLHAGPPTFFLPSGTLSEFSFVVGRMRGKGGGLCPLEKLNKKPICCWVSRSRFSLGHL